MKIQIIVTTMHQTDFSLLKKMNITTDVIIANQTNFNSFSKESINSGTAFMISTTTRGLSKNRNIGLRFVDKDTDYILFADDDVVFVDGYYEMILEELTSHPEAAAIKFNLYNISEEHKISMDSILKWQKATRLNMSSSGVCAFAIDYNYLIKYNLHFCEYFGSGTENFCGEDTIFLQEIINKGIPMYLSPKTVAGIDQTVSTWFKGYNEKFFRVAGMVFSAMYPKLARLLAIRSAYRFSKRADNQLGFLKILKCYLEGIRFYERT